MNKVSIKKDGGITPHLCICERCGVNETQGLTLGVIHKATDNEGRTYYSDRDQRGKTIRELRKHGIELNGWTELEENEKVPMGVCEECQTEIEYHKAVVRKGGLFFKCKECKQHGVIQPNEFTYAIKKSQGVPETELLGYEFNKCAEHSPP